VNRIRIISTEVTATAKIADSPTAKAIWNALPVESSVSTWGDEIYFEIPVELSTAADASAVVSMGDLAYWPPGNAFCVFFGPTPASQGGDIRAASAVNVFGKIDGDATVFKVLKGGETIRVERLEGD
jgi:hypothetical protein